MAATDVDTAAALRAITWTAVAVGAVILVIVLLRSIGAFVPDSRDSGAQNETAPFEPRRAELPGGFDPIPEFDTARAEVEFRGVACMRDAASLEARLYRVCARDE